MSIFKKGDRVSITATVEVSARDGSAVYVQPDGHYTSISLAPSDLKMLLPNLQPGEVVFDEETGGRYEFLAAADGDAWLRASSGQKVILPISGLCRLGDGQEKGQIVSPQGDE